MNQIKRNLQMIQASHAINMKGKFTFFVDITLDRRRSEYICTFPSEGIVVLETQGSSKHDSINHMVDKLKRDPAGWVRKGNAAINELTEMIDASKEATKQEEGGKGDDRTDSDQEAVIHTDCDPGDEHIEKRVAV